MTVELSLIEPSHIELSLYAPTLTYTGQKQFDCGNKSHNFGLTAARSRHTGGVQVLLCDGSARFISENIDLATWRALGTRGGNEVFGEF